MPNEHQTPATKPPADLRASIAQILRRATSDAKAISERACALARNLGRLAELFERPPTGQAPTKGSDAAAEGEVVR